MMKKPFWGGIHPKGNKSLSRGGDLPELQPQQVVLPMIQHIGAACTPLVQVGDMVKRGQKIGDGSGVCAPIHASVSGRVLAVEPRPHPSGRDVLSVVIENDYLDTHDETMMRYLDHKDLEPNTILQIIHDAGIVGMGGATFPTDVKAFSAIGKVDCVLLNACECEPYITADDTLICRFPQQVRGGALVLQWALKPERTVIAIEDNKPEAIAILKETIKPEDNIEIIVLPTRYPQGAEKQLIQAVTGRLVPAGSLPAAVGCAVFNVATAAAVQRAVYDGMPITRRVVTVTGDGVLSPRNFLVPIGTSFGDTIHAAGGLLDGVQKVISGGPMMGFAQKNLDAPVLKGTNAILCLKHGNETPENPTCIRCARCVSVCPMHLQPLYLYRYTKLGRLPQLDKFHLMDCIECGCCSYICPGRLPLVQTIREGKKLWKEANAK